MAEQQCLDEDVPQVKYSFVSIADLAKLEKDAVCGEFSDEKEGRRGASWSSLPIHDPDVLAVVKEVHELGSINSKATQKPVGVTAEWFPRQHRSRGVKH